MAFSEALAARVRELVASRAGLSEKKMFGGLAFLAGGRMFCGILGDELMVRVGPEEHARALARPHVRPMDFTGRPLKGYVFVGPAAITGKRALRGWVQKGLAFAAQLPARQDPAPERVRPGRGAPVEAPPRGFQEVFAELRRIAHRHRRGLSVLSESATEYILSAPARPDGARAVWFGGVRAGRSYVSFHLMPVYMFPDLLAGLSPALRGRMQGKSCFRFQRVVPALFAELDALTGASVGRLEREGLLGAGGAAAAGRSRSGPAGKRRSAGRSAARPLRRPRTPAGGRPRSRAP